MWVAFDAPAFRRTDAGLSAAADNASFRRYRTDCGYVFRTRLATIAALDGSAPTAIPSKSSRFCS